MNRAGLAVAWSALLLTGGTACAAEIPAPKLELIKQAMASMKIDARIHGLVAARVEAKVQAIRIQNPEASDSLLVVTREAIASVYADNMEGPVGLIPRVHTVLDRRLSSDDLKFVVNFRESDHGKRYRELAPRVVADAVEEGRAWAERLEPEIRERLEEKLRGTAVKF